MQRSHTNTTGLFAGLTRRHNTTSTTHIPTICSTKSTTVDILKSAQALEIILRDYLEIVRARRDEALKEKTAKAEHRRISEAEEEAAEETVRQNDEAIAILHAQLQAQLGTDAYLKLMESRPSASKQKPQLPQNLRAVSGSTLREYITHGPGPEEAEGSGAAATRSTRQKKRIAGHGGRMDVVPHPSEIGTS
ncbi:hypothetical protein B0H16DRAFT_1469622 [Mycena metata]|uniref:Uncharacterized protein n=1 Tax=Mycena metata TaxID=1033252 RepID=A0AAD7HXD9_9AGAR|nr:hypothetical protein B0H16DRAFT_1475556 [Mycena metata]KAJ7730455.1 hypothetical protein B0H16DRAFT_1469622 [Mycena metata]